MGRTRDKIVAARRPSGWPSGRNRRIPVVFGTLAAFAGIGLLLASCAASGAGSGSGGNRPSADAVRTGAAVALSFPYLAAADPKAAAHRALAERLVGSYVRVVIIDPGGGAYDQAGGVVIQASGTVVDASGLIVTAGHIAKGTRYRAEVTTADGRTRPAQILRLDPGRDLALLRIAPYPGIQPVRLADSDGLRRGDFALSIGSPGGRAGVATVGRVWLPKLKVRIDYSADSPWSFGDGIVLRMPIASRFSGGPVFDRDGGLIGVIAGHELGDTTRAYAVPSNAIAAFLRESAPGR